MLFEDPSRLHLLEIPYLHILKCTHIIPTGWLSKTYKDMLCAIYQAIYLCKCSVILSLIITLQNFCKFMLPGEHFYSTTHSFGATG